MDNIGIPFRNIITPTGSVDVIPTATMQRSILGKRSWKERLFTLPWKPFKKNKVIGYEPMQEAIKMGNKIFCAPQIAEKVIENLESGKSMLGKEQ
jgi:hypothetical protein